MTGPGEAGSTAPAGFGGQAGEGPRDGEPWLLRLYVAGRSSKSVRALANLEALCREAGANYEVEVIDLLEHPELAQRDQILAIPTLVRRLPPPMRKIIGDLSNTDRVLVGLDLVPGAQGGG